MSWPIAFVLTLLVELPIYVFLLRRWCSPVVAAGLGLLANAITHPVLWVVLQGIAAQQWQWAAVFVGAEVIVWLVEWGVLLAGLRLGARRATAGELAAVAGLANLCSALLGLVVAFG